MTVHADHVDVAVEATAEDLLHYGLIELREVNEYTAEEVREAASHHWAEMLSALVIRDGAGAPLPGKLVSTEISRTGDETKARTRLTSFWLNAKFRYAAKRKRPLGFLTLQHVPNPETTQILLTRMGTTVRQAERDGAAREIILTSGGNAETLEFDWSGDKAATRESAKTSGRKDGRAWLGDERFKTLHALLDVDEKGPVLHVVIPAPIAETWEPIRRASRDVLAPDEQEKVSESWKKRLANRFPCRIDGEDSTVAVERVALIGPADSERSLPATPQPLGFHSARIVGRIRLSDSRPDSIAVTWKLFNEAVPAANVLIVEAKQATAQPISTYAPTFRWRRDD